MEEAKKCFNLVFNKGKDDLDSATIHIGWTLPGDFSEGKPTHVLVLDIDPLKESMSDEISCQEKYLCNVLDGERFIQIH